MSKTKVAIITGSTSGIGLGIAQALAQQGYNLCLNGLETEAEAKKICQEIASTYSIQVIYSNANMLNSSSIQSMIDDTVSQFGRVDILINNAGIQHVAPVDSFPAEKWDAIIQINLSAVFHATQAAIPHMKSYGWGRIINIASAHGLVASPYKSAYVAAKHGVVGFTKSIALEVAEQGITCNSICPGYVLTPLVEGQIRDTALARGINEENVIKDIMLANQPTKKFVKIEEVAAMVNYLASDVASSITGTHISIDGGWTAH